VTFSIEVAPTAERQLRRLDAENRARIAAHIRSLGADPRPSGAEQLSAPESLWRIRVGSYRVVYQIRSSQLVVLVLRIGHRRDVYRQLNRLRRR
jgi:mRNA interferase RelE/StbE